MPPLPGRGDSGSQLRYGLRGDDGGALLCGLLEWGTDAKISGAKAREQQIVFGVQPPLLRPPPPSQVVVWRAVIKAGTAL